MKRQSVFAKLTLLLVLFLCAAVFAVDTIGIDRVRKKEILAAEDYKVIEQFIRDAIAELVSSNDFTRAARLRAVITSRQSEQVQYREEYTKHCRKFISEALEQAKEREDENRHEIRLNLMILVAEFEDIGLIDVALGALEDKDKAVQYWAVRSLGSVSLTEQLKERGRSSIIEKIAAEFEAISEKSGPEAAGLMVDFTTFADNEAMDKLLLKLADVRIAGYKNRTAKPWSVDMKILKLLCDKTIARQSQARELGRRFAQFYSYAMQKYIYHLGQQAELSEADAHMLASVLVEIEDKCIGRLTGLKQGVIKNAVEKDSSGALILEHGRLLGDDIRQGVLPLKFGFDYGKGEDGSVLNKPVVLAEGGL